MQQSWLSVSDGRRQRHSVGCPWPGAAAQGPLAGSYCLLTSMKLQSWTTGKGVSVCGPGEHAAIHHTMRMLIKGHPAGACAWDDQTRLNGSNCRLGILAHQSASQRPLHPCGAPVAHWARFARAGVTRCFGAITACRFGCCAFPAPEGSCKTAVMMQMAVKALDFYHRWTGVAQPLPKFDLVAVPGKGVCSLAPSSTRNDLLHTELLHARRLRQDHEALPVRSQILDATLHGAS